MEAADRAASLDRAPPVAAEPGQVLLDRVPPVAAEPGQVLLDRVPPAVAEPRAARPPHAAIAITTPSTRAIFSKFVTLGLLHLDVALRTRFAVQPACDDG